ncbi:MAG: gamma-glutamyltransferase [Actinomycetota bacterium]
MRTLLSIGAAVMILAAGSSAGVADGPSHCVPGRPGCLPTPAQCATGRYNGFHRGPYPGAFAICAGGGGRVAHYSGGDPRAACGAVIAADQVIVGDWSDPNVCLAEPTPPGPGVRGNRFIPAVNSGGGVIATESAVAAAVGRDVLRRGGNVVDAAVAAVFAYGVVRPENCGIGGFGVLLYRGADGRIAALDFGATAPNDARPDSLEGSGIDDHATGHRVVGVPGVVAGMAAALERFGTLPLSDVIAPAERLARDGVVVNTYLANSYTHLASSEFVAPAGGLPFEPVPAKLATARLRLFPEAARIYLKDGLFAPSPGTRLALEDYADSLALIARVGPDAFYKGPIARAIADEMARSRRSPYPGDRGLMTARDLAGYRPVWREPLVSVYRGTTILGAPPPVSSVIPMEMLNILEGFDLAAIGHSSADHLHLVAEAQKLAYADRDAYLSDPAFRRVPSDVMTSDEFAARRRALIARDHAGTYGPGAIPGYGAGSASPAAAGHTTHVSAIDRDGNAVAILCTLGPAFGSAVVAPGTGFLLNSTMHLFEGAGHPDQIEAGKRPVAGAAPIIAVRDDNAVLVAGGAGGDLIPIAIAHIALNILTFGMGVDEAVDMMRSDERTCCELTLEESRVPPGARATLERWGHELSPLGEYGFGSLVQLAGSDPSAQIRASASDPRGEHGASAE